MANSKHTVLGARYTIDEVAAAETDGPGPELGEALPLTGVASPEHSVVTDEIEFSYSATATDRGIAGMLSGEPGLVYNGHPLIAKRIKVSVKDVDVIENAITGLPDAEDTCTIGLFVNSTLMSIADEGFAPDETFDVAGSPFEFNISETVLDLTEKDVIRVALLGPEANEELLDWDVSATGILEIT